MMNEENNDQETQFFKHVEQLKSAVAEILPDTDAQLELEDLCRKLTSNFRDVHELSVTKRAPVIAIASTSTKDARWVVSVMRKELAKQIGEVNYDAVEGLGGFGPVRPDWFPRQSQFAVISCDAWNNAQPWSCLAIDPHKTDRVDADIVLYLVKFEDLQTDAAIRAIKPLAGIPIVPVILGVTENGGRDVEAFARRLESALGKNPCLPRLEFPDFRDKETTASIADAEQQIWSQCQGLVNVSESQRRQIQRERCEAIVRRLDTESRNILRRSDFEQVNQSIRDLMDKEKQVLRTQTMKWISGSSDLRIPIRIRLRLIACELTPPLCFPFRSVLGALALTTGVWDRVAMAMLGSPVSLALAAYQTGGQLWKNRNSLQELNQNAGDQFSRNVIGDLIDPLSETRRTITSRLPGSQALSKIERDDIHVRGAESLLQDVRGILDAGCRKELPGKAVFATAVVCTLIFAVLASGPIIALYADYVKPLVDVWLGRSDGITSFPLPEVARIFTGFLLGVIPGIIGGMILLAFLTRREVVERLTDDIQGSIHDRIDTMIKDDSLRLEGLDDSFGQIRFLNGIIESGNSSS